MDQNSPSSSSNQSPSVDTLLNDILNGSPVSDSPMPSVSSAPVSTNTVANHMHDMLAPSPAASSSRLPLGDSEPGVPSSSRPAPVAAMPTVPMTPPISAQPVAPLSPVSPVSAVAPQTVSNAGGESFQVAQAPKAGMPKATIAAAIAVFAVVLGGVGAGVVLSGENQDVRNQAYVAPAQQQIDKNNPPETLSGETMSFVMTPKNAFIVVKDKYPNATSQSISGGGISGTLYSAKSAEGSTILFAEMTGVTPPSEASLPVAWAEHDDGTYSMISSLELNQDDSKSYVSFDSLTSIPVVGFSLSYENPLSITDTSSITAPTQKALDVRL